MANLLVNGTRLVTQMAITTQIRQWSGRSKHFDKTRPMFWPLLLNAHVWEQISTHTFLGYRDEITNSYKGTCVASGIVSLNAPNLRTISVNGRS